MTCPSGQGGRVALPLVRSTLPEGFAACTNRRVRTMEPLSEILSSVKMNGAVFFTAEFSAPWGVSTPAAAHLAQAVAPESEHLIVYHLVAEGAVTAGLPSGECLQLGPGDVVIVPHGHAHHLHSPDATRPFPNYGVNEKIVAKDLSPLQAGGGGDAAHVVCGFLACDPQLCQPILSGLPALFKVHIRTDSAGTWLENSILHLVEEAGSGAVGSQAMLAKLSEALFVDTLRRYVAQLPEHQQGWLTAARDPVVGKALGLLHTRPADPWTIASLAQECALSRSALTERFARYLNEAPMAYLTRWRLHLAANALAKTSRSVAEIAAQVGYESEAAFNRAFKREFGEPPGRYRAGRRG